MTTIKFLINDNTYTIEVSGHNAISDLCVVISTLAESFQCFGELEGYKTDCIDKDGYLKVSITGKVHQAFTLVRTALTALADQFDTISIE